MQVRDLYHYQMEVNQNRRMSLLTIITTVFMPLTVITGWFGMNFQYMPELTKKWTYPTVAGICVLIVVLNIIILKRRKWF